RAHAVLADVSIGYPPLQGRFPRATHPCATKPPGEPNSLVRLACVKHAASVRSEPGSNSHVHAVALTSNSRLRAHDSASRRGPRIPSYSLTMTINGAPEPTVRQPPHLADRPRSLGSEPHPRSRANDQHSGVTPPCPGQDE